MKKLERMLETVIHSPKLQLIGVGFNSKLIYNLFSEQHQHL